MKSKIIVLLFLFISLSKITAQKFELGKVSKEELEQKVHPTDTSAVAAILYKKAKTYFKYNYKTGFTVIHDYQFRIKIYKKEGLSWATKAVSFYVGYENINPDMLSFSDGITYNLENGVITKTKLNTEGVFKKKINKYWKEISITMPNAKVGSIIEYKYSISSENVVKFPVFNFQEDIPINYVEYKTDIPEFFIYRPILVGFFKAKSDSKITNGYQSYPNEYNQTLQMSYKQISTIYTAENVPAFTVEPFIDNAGNYKSAVQHELDRTRFPDTAEKDYSTTWEGVAKMIYKNDDFGKELNERDYILQDLSTILKKDGTEAEKMQTIFKFVQNKMNWNKEHSYWVDKGVKKAYLEQTGNTAEINFILIAMLKLAGLNANPVLLSTVDHGIPVYPNRTVFNAVIAAVEIDGKQLLLDATNKYNAPNILPFNDLNWTGRLIKEDGSSQEINLAPNTPSSKNVNLMAVIAENGVITGKTKIQRTTYRALQFRENYAEVNQNDYLEKLENKQGEMQITDYAIYNKKTNLDEPVTETYAFASANYVEIIGNKMFINPMLFFTESKNPFTQEKRELPIYFEYPKQEKYSIAIEIPDGYIVDSLPQPLKITTGEEVAFFTFNIQAVEKNIQILVTQSINSTLVSAEFYVTLKDFFQKAIDKQNEKIVLKKI